LTTNSSDQKLLIVIDLDTNLQNKQLLE